MIGDTYCVKLVQRVLHVALNVLPDGHILDLVHEGNDTGQRFHTILEILPRTLTDKGVQLPVGEWS